jgi:hypothetical protein
VSNKYAEQYTVNASTTGTGSAVITIANSNIAGATSVVIVQLVSATTATFVKSAVPASGSVTVTLDANSANGDKLNYIVINP